MNVQWKKLCVSLLVWVVIEMTLTVTGLDDVADYSEFILAARETAVYIRS